MVFARGICGRICAVRYADAEQKEIKDGDLVTNVITANLSKCRFYRASPVYQYNYGMKLVITGLELPTAYEVDFSNDINGQSITQIGGADGVSIPSQFFQPGQAIYCWLRVHPTQDSGITTATIVIPISPRAVITDEEPTPEEQSAIDEAIAVLNNAVEQTAADVVSADASAQAAQTAQAGAETAESNASGYAQSAASSAQSAHTYAQEAEASKNAANTAKNAADGARRMAEYAGTSASVAKNRAETAAANAAKSASDAEDAVEHYPQITNGIWYVWDVNAGEYVSTGISATGFSPSASVAQTATGATITVTDKQGTTTVDISNGAPGQPGQDGADGVGVPAGGTTGQVLAKSSGVDYSTEWVTPYTGTVTETVSGATPTITAQDNHRYVCGEVSTLDITLPASGIVDVVFKSGSTATLLTVTPPTGVTVRWANGFDPDNLDANTTYEINIMDGLGVAATWT